MRLDSFRRARELARQARPPLGDLAVLKMDGLGVDARLEHRAALDPVRGYLPEVDLQALARLPEGTFGRAYATFMSEHGLDPFVLTDAVDDEIRGRNAYGIRVATTHDMLHVLLGFDTSWEGELGVLAFSHGQRWAAYLPIAVLFAWVIYPLRTGLALRRLWRAYDRGLRLGEAAPFVLGVRLEERFAEPLDRVRADLGLAAADPARVAA